MGNEPSKSFVQNKWFYAGLPYLSIYASAISLAFTSSDSMVPVWDGITIAGLIPSMFYLPNAGLGNLGISSSFMLASYGLKEASGFYGDQSLFDVSNNLGAKYAYWSYYQGYVAAEKAIYGVSPNPLNDGLKFKDLVEAPWDLRNLSRVQTWLPLTLLISGEMAGAYFSTGGAKAVWTTGKAYIGHSEIPIGVGLISTFALSAINYTLTGIGEEAAFRGIGYDQMKTSLGVWPAKALDATLFSAVHLPQQIKEGDSLSTIVMAQLFGAAAGLSYQATYDAGGLRASVAEHMWFDTLQAVGIFLLTSGTTNASVLSLSATFPM